MRIPSIKKTTKLIATSARRLLARYESPTSAQTSEDLRKLIVADGYLFHHYQHAYQRLQSLLDASLNGPVVEIGAGSCVSRHFVDGIISSDLKFSPSLDVVLDGCHLPFRDESITGIIMKDSLHHIPDLEQLFSEITRVMAPGGRVAIMDPYWGWLARVIYRWLHPEPFDDKTSDWSFEAKSPNDSNQALLKLILRRDRQRLETSLPGFEVTEHGATLGPSFLLSGGLHGRTLFPSEILVRMFDWEDRQSRWLDHYRFAYLVTLRKRANDA